MNLFSQPRLAALFEAIEAEITPQQELARQLGVSSRTIRTDINLLNDFLSDYGARILLLRGQGYCLRIEDQEALSRLPGRQKQPGTIPRSAGVRRTTLLLKLLMAAQPIKLDSIAESWYVSRATLQGDMPQVRQKLADYALHLHSIPRQGLKLAGEERAIRSCITDLLWQQFTTAANQSISLFQQEILSDIDLAYIEKMVQHSLNRFDLRLSNEGRHYFIFSCAVAILRITHGHELDECLSEPMDPALQGTLTELCQGFSYFLGAVPGPAEITWLARQIAAHRLTNTVEPEQGELPLVDHILCYINQGYNYDLRHDDKLKADLLSHLAAMLTRSRYQIHTTNPLLEEIKQFYPFAYDVTLSALRSADQYLPYPLSEDEIGYIAVHIGVGLERQYGAGFRRYPHALLVSDAGNATLRMLEAKISREFPQIKLQRILPQHQYQRLSNIDEDFVITTVRLEQKNRPIVKIAPFPTAYQLEQLGRLAMLDRTKPYILQRFFNEKNFMIIEGKISQEQLFHQICQRLERQRYVPPEFYPSLVERESLVSTFLGENIALPHTLGLMAKKTVVVTILAPEGIEWHTERKEIAQVIFLLAISKEEYEEAMAIYDLFVTFVREKATKRLLNSKNFNEFQMIAIDSLIRGLRTEE